MQLFWNVLCRHSAFRSIVWQACRRQRLSCHNLYIHFPHYNVLRPFGVVGVLNFYVQPYFIVCERSRQWVGCHWNENKMKVITFLQLSPFYGLLHTLTGVWTSSGPPATNYEFRLFNIFKCTDPKFAREDRIYIGWAVKLFIAIMSDVYWVSC
jgi:hypothetical protein